MSSSIDSSKPADDTPAVKADLRANLETARIELDHGGFTALAPSNYGPPASDRVGDHLAAIDDALGAAGGAETFVELSDTPGAYSGEASKFVKVKSDETGLEFVASGGATNADAVDYDPPWTGVVTRSVEARLMDEAHGEDFGATGDGSTDDAGAIQAAIDSPAQYIVFGPKTYAIGTRIDVPQGKVLIFKGSIFTAHGNLPTTGDESALFRWDGSAPSSLRGNSIYGMAQFNTGGRALYGWLIEPASGEPQRWDCYGGAISFNNGFATAIRMTAGTWWGMSLRGILVNANSADNVAIDIVRTTNTTTLLERCTIGMNGSSGSAIGIRIAGHSTTLIDCSVDKAPSTGAAIEIANTTNGRVTMIGCHLEGNDGILLRTTNSTNIVKWIGGLLQTPTTNTGTLFDIAGNSEVILDHPGINMHTNFTTFANIGGGGFFGVYEGQRDLSASSPFNQYSGSGEAFQMWKGKRINLHNSP